jgi:NAD(P)-dependent dehydrogenase (short-subunit alcohol dehydrogenase family)
MAESLAGQVALVTGASRGIGRAIADELVAAGAHVVGAARPSAHLDGLADVLARAPAPGLVVPTDVRDPAAVEGLFERIDAEFGRLDMLVNNAGIAHAAPFKETPPSAWREVFATNVEAVFLVTQAAITRMLRAGHGQIVFIASDAAIRGIPRMAAYCASKHAVLGFARALDAEYAGQGIRITTLLPGPVNTTILREQADQFALPQPADIAATVRHVLGLPDRVQVKEVLLVPRGA